MLEILLSVGAVFAHLTVTLALLSFERRSPSATLSWLLTIIFLPGVGLVLYLLIGTKRARRLVRRAQKESLVARDRMERTGIESKLAAFRALDTEPRTSALMALGETLASTPSSRGNSVRMLVDGAATYASIRTALDAAEHHIHIDFYIIRPDEAGTDLRAILVERARQGIEVRVTYDAIGSATLPDGFWNPLLDAGGWAAAFNPASRILSWIRRRDRIDFRNHRKIVVVDGRVGFTGGINVGREYLGLDPEIGRWRDTHMRVEGPAVLSLQEVFADDWYRASGKMLDGDSYFPEPISQEEDCVVQVVDSGPDRTWSSIGLIYVQAIMSAENRVWITNPYFVPDATVQNALMSAALRGVDVRLLLPERGDWLIVSLASRSYYQDLMEAGIRIYHYKRGFVHAKTMVVDDWVGTIGSANMDVRSFHLNFELNAFVRSTKFARELAAQFERDLERAEEVDASHRGAFTSSMLQTAARLMSPLL